MRMSDELVAAGYLVAMKIYLWAQQVVCFN